MPATKTNRNNYSNNTTWSAVAFVVLFAPHPTTTQTTNSNNLVNTDRYASVAWPGLGSDSEL